MTSWIDVINYVRTRYEVMEETDSWLRFRLDTGQDRTQQVSVHHVPESDGVAWVEISSAVGRADEIDLRRLLELAGTSPVGGAAVVDGVALLKHTVPLEDLSVREEFARPLMLLVTAADAFEHELTRSDRF
ncbi:type III secretion system chaperone family protein [Saccharothrix stipae]